MGSVFRNRDLESLIERIRSLQEDNFRQWGSMTVSQMLHHCLINLQIYPGEIAVSHKKLRYPRWFTRFYAFYLPWPKNAPTIKEANMVRHNIGSEALEKEKELLITYLRKLHQLPADFIFPPHPVFGKMRRRRIGIHAYRHTDWHLQQFSA